jgi:dolichol-phosphate mannosyltransferase
MSQVSFIVPAFNEEENIANTLREIMQACGQYKISYELIVVDDGSRDATYDRAEEFLKGKGPHQVIRLSENVGFGAAYRQGLLQAKLPLSLMIPGDNAYPASSISNLLAAIGKSDIVCTYTQNTKVRSLLRRIISRVYVGALNTAFGLRLKYYNGLALIPTNLAREVPISNGFCYAAQAMLSLIHRHRCTIYEVGVEITERKSGRSKAFTLRNFKELLSVFVPLFWEFRIIDPMKHSVSGFLIERGKI